MGDDIMKRVTFGQQMAKEEGREEGEKKGRDKRKR